MALNTLKPNGLYILLFIRHDSPETTNFHWAFYLHKGAQGGTKYHITNISQGQGWVPAHGDTRAVMKEFFLVGLSRIADVPTGRYGFLDRIMTYFDDKLNTPEMTYRAWILVILTMLQHPVDGQRVLECDDLLAL